MVKKTGILATILSAGPIGIIAALLIVAASGFGIYRLYYNLFILPDKHEELEREVVIKDETDGAIIETQQQALERVIERSTTHTIINDRVRDAKETIYGQPNSNTVNVDVDAAGRASLCGLHQDYCPPTTPD